MEWLFLATLLGFTEPDTLKYEMYQYDYKQLTEQLEILKKVETNKQINNKLDSIIIQLKQK